MDTSDIFVSFTLDRSAATPLFRQLYAAVKEAVLRGALSPGMQLPPTRELCRLMGV